MDDFRKHFMEMVGIDFSNLLQSVRLEKKIFATRCINLVNLVNKLSMYLHFRQQRKICDILDLSIMSIAEVMSSFAISCRINLRIRQGMFMIVKIANEHV